MSVGSVMPSCFHRLLYVCSTALLGLCTSCAVTSAAQINAQFADDLNERYEHYKVKAGDQLTLRIYDQAGDLSTQTLLILPDGRSDPYFMPDYRFTGKTIPEIETDVRDLMTRSEVKNPEVSLIVAPAAATVYVSGEVKRPGPLIMTTRMTLGEALASVGRDTTHADTDYVLLRRPYRDPSHPDSFRVDISDLGEDIYLLPGDQVHVPRTYAAVVVVYMRDYLFGIFPFTGYFSALAAAF